MQLAIIQFAPVLGDLDATIKILKPLFRKAKNAKLVVLPELANSGYNFDNRTQAMALSEEVDSSKFLQFLQESCRKYEFALATGFSEKEGDKLYNSAVLLDKNGIIGKYRKLHLFMNEKNIYEPGDVGLPTFELEGVTIGMLVCFDWMFPEVWRKMALKGVDLILHPSNLVLPYAQSVVPSYALVNRLYVATANRIGTEGNLSFTGKSLIADPKGVVIAKAEAAEEEVIMAEIEPKLSRNKMITPMNDAFKDRRTDIYE